MQAVHQQQGGGDVRDGGGREETAASSGDDRSVRERRSVVRRRRTTGENNDVGGEGKHAAQVHLTALLPQPPEVEKVRQDASTNKLTAKSEKKKRVLRFLVSWPNIVDWQCT